MNTEMGLVAILTLEFSGCFVHTRAADLGSSQQTGEDLET